MKNDGIFRLEEHVPGEDYDRCTLFMDAAIEYHFPFNASTSQYADSMLEMIKHLFSDDVSVIFERGTDGVRIKVHTYPPFDDAGFTLFLSYDRIPDKGDNYGTN